MAITVSGLSSPCAAMKAASSATPASRGVEIVRFLAETMRSFPADAPNAEGIVASGQEVERIGDPSKIALDGQPPIRAHSALLDPSQ
jgi:hypothetical protein